MALLIKESGNFVYPTKMYIKNNDEWVLQQDEEYMQNYIDTNYIYRNHMSLVNESTSYNDNGSITTIIHKSTPDENYELITTTYPDGHILNKKYEYYNSLKTLSLYEINCDDCENGEYIIENLLDTEINIAAYSSFNIDISFNKTELPKTPNKQYHIIDYRVANPAPYYGFYIRYAVPASNLSTQQIEIKYLNEANKSYDASTQNINNIDKLHYIISYKKNAYYLVKDAINDNQLVYTTSPGNIMNLWRNLFICGTINNNNIEREIPIKLTNLKIDLAI